MANIKNLKPESTFFLDQGEFLGGAVRFLIDFLLSLSDFERKKVLPMIIGGKNEKYREALPDNIFEDFMYPAVKKHKFIATFRLLWAARKLKVLAEKKGAVRFFSNTPRTHFVMYLAKKFFRIKGTWICMFHDFTVPKFLVKKIGATADILIANSVPTRNFLRARIDPAHYEKIRIVENGIDFKKIPQGTISKCVKNILILGRIDPRKGQFFALEAAQKLKKTNPDLQFQVVGSPVEADPATMAYDQKCRDFVRAKKLKNVRFIVEVDDPFREIEKSDLVLFLPTEPETFGRVVIEALALNKLVISFDETGPREIIKGYENFLGQIQTSLLVEKEAEALAQKIQFFVNNPVEILSFTENTRAYIEQNYALAETKKRLLGLLLG